MQTPQQQPPKPLIPEDQLSRSTDSSWPMEDSGASSLTTETEIPVTCREVKMDDSQQTLDSSLDAMNESFTSKTSAVADEATPKPEASGPETTTGTEPTVIKDDNGFTFYKCRFCGLTYNYLTTLKAHERVHDVVAPYTCNKCSESFYFMCELEYHAKTHLQQKGYKCDCGRTFFQYTDLLYHKHPGEDPDPVPAAPEPRQVVSRPAYDPSEFPAPDYAVKGYEPKHPLRVYSDIRSRPYHCQYCGKAYPDCRQLAYHMHSHRGERIFNPRASRYLMARNENSYISPGVYP